MTPANISTHTQMDWPRFQPAGDSALLVTFAQRIDLTINQQAQALARSLAGRRLPGLGEAVPGYATVLIHYDALALAYDEVESWLRICLAETVAQSREPGRVEIPVQYGGQAGPDLDFVAAHNHLTPAEVVRIHTARDYPVYMMGFTPGFPYLGGLDPAIAAPRLATPRSRVPGGSVGIAGQQTGVYPLDSPGGWRIIGRTPLHIFDPHRDPPFLLEPGDLVRFKPISEGEEENGR